MFSAGSSGTSTPAVVLERPHGRHDHRRRGAQTGGAAQDVDELLRAEVGAEAGLGDDVVGEAQRRTGGDRRVAAVRDVGERPSVDESRGVLEGLHQVGRQRVAEDRRHGAVGAEVAREHGLAVAGVRDDDPPEALLAGRRGSSRGRRSPSPRTPRRCRIRTRAGTRCPVRRAPRPRRAAARSFTSSTRRHVMRRTSMPSALPWWMWLSMSDGEQVRGERDRGEVAREVQVDVLHRHDLRAPSPGRTALHPEHRPERGFAQADHRALADARERIAEADRGRRLPLAGGGRRKRRDEHELALRAILDALQERTARPSPCTARTVRGLRPGCRGSRRSGRSDAGSPPGRSRYCSGSSVILPRSPLTARSAYGGAGAGGAARIAGRGRRSAADRRRPARAAGRSRSGTAGLRCRTARRAGSPRRPPCCAAGRTGRRPCGCAAPVSTSRRAWALGTPVDHDGGCRLRRSARGWPGDRGTRRPPSARPRRPRARARSSRRRSRGNRRGRSSRTPWPASRTGPSGAGSRRRRPSGPSATTPYSATTSAGMPSA